MGMGDISMLWTKKTEIHNLLSTIIGEAWCLRLKLRRNPMENRFSVSEMEKLRLDYTLGRDLDCPRCGRILREWFEEAGVLPGQLPGGTTLNYLWVECEEEEISGRIMFGN